MCNLNSVEVCFSFCFGKSPCGKKKSLGRRNFLLISRRSSGGNGYPLRAKRLSVSAGTLMRFGRNASGRSSKNFLRSSGTSAASAFFQPGRLCGVVVCGSVMQRGAMGYSIWMTKPINMLASMIYKITLMLHPKQPEMPLARRPTILLIPRPSQPSRPSAAKTMTNTTMAMNTMNIDSIIVFYWAMARVTRRHRRFSRTRLLASRRISSSRQTPMPAVGGKRMDT